MGTSTGSDELCHAMPHDVLCCVVLLFGSGQSVGSLSSVVLPRNAYHCCSRPCPAKARPGFCCHMGWAARSCLLIILADLHIQECLSSTGRWYIIGWMCMPWLGQSPSFCCSCGFAPAVTTGCATAVRRADPVPIPHICTRDTFACRLLELSLASWSVYTTCPAAAAGAMQPLRRLECHWQACCC